jgi:hypothetical protein
MSVGSVLAAPAAALVSVQSAAVDTYTLTTGRLVGAVADGGPGTGNGVVGGAVALVLGLIATVLGWRALARSRRTGRPADRPEYERAFE